jgi:hypothetical protein
MDNAHGHAHNLLAALLRVALVVALAAAVWGVYRRLPHDDTSAVAARDQQRAATTLRIRLRRAEVGFPVSAQKIPVQLYPINMTAARDEFDSEHRPGQRFEDFATRLMGERQPLSAELDEHGEAVLAVPPGKWWVHAAVTGERELTWRLPVEVAGREKTVELTPDNAYTRAKKF